MAFLTNAIRCMRQDFYHKTSTYFLKVPPRKLCFLIILKRPLNRPSRPCRVAPFCFHHQGQVLMSFKTTLIEAKRLIGMFKKSFKSMDWRLIVPTILLLVIGYIMIFSTTSFKGLSEFDDAYFFIKRQSIFLMVPIFQSSGIKNGRFQGIWYRLDYCLLL